MRALFTRSSGLRRILGLGVTSLVALLLIRTAPAAITELQAQGPNPVLLQLSNLNYLGAFRVPFRTALAPNTFAYGAAGLAFNSAHGSLFMTGHDQFQLVGELSIPVLKTGALTSLNQAGSLLPGTALIDPFEGKINLVNPPTLDPNPKKIGGLLAYLGKLYASAYSYYDGNKTQILSHFASGLDLTVLGDVTGPFQVGTLPLSNGAPYSSDAGYVAGYMGLVPPEWQAAFGGPVLTGQCCIAIVGRTSYGPALFSIDPAKLGVQIPLNATPLVYYPGNHPLGLWDGTNPNFNGSTQVRGVVFPNGSKSVLFFGRHGENFCYGSGTTNLALDRTLVGSSQPGVIWCYDPEDNSKGTHGYPYTYQVWAYNADDMVQVKNGVKQPWEITPYAKWTLSFPYAARITQINGAAYDQATGRLFVSQGFGDAADQAPIVHVFQVSLTPTVADTTPPTLSITSPQAGTIGGIFNITVNAADNLGVAYVRYYLDGQQLAFATAAPYSTAWDTSTVPAGVHTLTAVARDGSGNSSTTASVTVTVRRSILNITDTAVTEGKSGTINATFIVSLSDPSLTNVTVSYATANGTASAPADYTAKSGTLTFTPGGSLTQNVTVSVNGDSNYEADETFAVNLTNANGATIIKGQGVGTIINDDFPAVSLNLTKLVVGDVVTATASSGPAFTGDWVGLYAAGAPDGTYVDWKYLNGTRTKPSIGMNTASVNFTPPAAGTYNVRFFLNDSITKLATSAPITVTATPSIGLNATTFTAGNPITATISNGPGTAGDWVGLYASGAPDGTYVDWKYLGSGTKSKTSGVTGGSVAFTAPSTAGTYNVRFFLNDSITKLATSAPITVNPPTPSIALNATTFTAGDTITATISNGPGTAGDWVGLYASGAPDGTYVDWKYLGSGTKSKTSGVTGGSVAFTAPAAGGSYNVRFFLNDSITKLATSAPLTVSVPPSIGLNATTFTAGDLITATISNGPGTAGDWVGLYRAGDPDGSYQDWDFLGSQTRSKTSSAATGSVSFTAPAAGMYNVRFFLNDSITRLATSAPITVSPSAPVVTVSATSVGPGATVMATVANGPATAGDWVGVYATAAPNGTYEDWKYLNGTKTATVGTAGATVSFTMPTTPGTYHVRFFLNDSIDLLAQSATITVTGSLPSVAVNQTTVAPGGTITATVANGPATTGDWVGVYATGDPDSTYQAWAYLNGTRTAPVVGVTGADVVFTMPTTPGTYNVRLFLNDSIVKLATSLTIDVKPLTSSSNPSLTTGSPIFTAAVTGATAGGSVDFFDGAVRIGSAPIVCRDVCVATFGGSMLTLADSPHVISATYNGAAIGTPIEQRVEEGTFAVTDLGTLGDPSQGGGAPVINAAGAVVGTRDGTGVFVYSGGVTTDIGIESGPYGINAAGQIVGDAGGQAFLRTGSLLAPLGPCCADGLMPPLLINDAGQVALSDGHHAFFSSDGVRTDLGDLGGGYSSAWDLNTFGQVVGLSTTGDQVLHAFIYDRGVMRDLGPLPGVDSRPAINDAGQIVIGSGRINDSGQVATAAAIDSGGVVTPLPMPFGALAAMSNAAELVGPGADDTRPVMIYSGGQAMDARALVPASSGWTLETLDGVNDRGRIVGRGLLAGQAHVLLLTPIPAAANVTWTNPAAIVEGAALGSAQLNATANVPGRFAYSPAAGTVLPAGLAQVLSVTFTPDDTTRYQPVSATVAIDVLTAAR